MKYKWFSLLFSSLFLLGTTSFAHASLAGLDGGIILDVFNVKTANSICAIPIPDNYVTQDGTLLLPLEITIVNNKNTLVYSVKSTQLKISLPAYLSGNYSISIEVGDFYYVQKITL